MKRTTSLRGVLGLFSGQASTIVIEGEVAATRISSVAHEDWRHELQHREGPFSFMLGVHGTEDDYLN